MKPLSIFFLPYVYAICMCYVKGYLYQMELAKLCDQSVSGWADHLGAFFIERSLTRATSYPWGAPPTLNQPVRPDVQRIAMSLQAPRFWRHILDLSMFHEGQLCLANTTHVCPQ